MSVEVRDRAANEKIKRLVLYLLELEGERLRSVLQHLPPDFERTEHETICQMIGRIVKDICRCRAKLCCL